MTRIIALPERVFYTEIELLKFLEQDCGAEGFAIERGEVVALRFNDDGTPRAVKRYQLEIVGDGGARTQ